jgi:hypothetical protein
METQSAGVAGKPLLAALLRFSDVVIQIRLPRVPWRGYRIPRSVGHKSSPVDEARVEQRTQRREYLDRTDLHTLLHFQRTPSGKPNKSDEANCERYELRRTRYDTGAATPLGPFFSRRRF